MSAFGSSISRFASSKLTGYGGKFKPKKGQVVRGRVLTPSEQRQVRYKLRAAAYTDRGVDWHRLFKFYDVDNSGEIGMIEFKRLLRSDAKIPVSQLSDSDVRALYRSVDTDGSGDIDADEFLAWVRGPEEEQTHEEFTEESGEWAHSSGYGNVSPRKLHSPSQRRYSKKGWITNNDENSEAEAAVLRRHGSAVAHRLDLMEETGSEPSSPRSQLRKTETTEETLNKVRAAFSTLKADYAKQELVLKDALLTIETLTRQRGESEKKMKDQRRTIAVLNREGRR
jgi:hypothetical protein